MTGHRMQYLLAFGGFPRMGANGDQADTPSADSVAVHPQAAELGVAVLDTYGIAVVAQATGDRLSQTEA